MQNGKGYDDEAGVLGLLEQLIADQCLDADQEALASRAVSTGLAALDEPTRKQLLEEVVEPYCVDCEACGATPRWSERLDVYDTGLCAPCFAALDGGDTLGVRPGWMPLPAPVEEEVLPPETDTADELVSA
jgi:hypothetical protein